MNESRSTRESSNSSGLLLLRAFERFVDELAALGVGDDGIHAVAVRRQSDGSQLDSQTVWA